MNDKEFINTFNEYYPFERYIVKEPKKINYLFDDVLLTELFVPSTEIKPVKGLDFKQQKELESAKRKLRTKISKLEELIAEKEAEKEETENRIYRRRQNDSRYVILWRTESRPRAEI